MSTIPLPLPVTVPSANTGEIYTVNVKKDPLTGEFSSVSNAITWINANATPSATQYYRILVWPGTYSEPELTIPQYVILQGTDHDVAIITPNGAHIIVNLPGNSGVKNLTLKNATPPYAGVTAISAVNIGVDSHVFSVVIDRAANGIVVSATTTDSSIIIEHVTMYDITTTGISAISTGNTLLTNIVAFTMYSPATLTNPTYGIYTSGANALTSAATIGFKGESATGTAYYATNGSQNFIKAFTAIQYADCIYSANAGANAYVAISGAIFANNTRNINIQSATTSGYFDGYSEGAKTIIATGSSFFITNEDANIVTVAKRGGEYTSVKSAVDAITDNSSTNPYIISVGPGIYVENPITMKSYVHIIGVGHSATTIQANNANANLITGAISAELIDVSVTGATGVGFADVYYAGGGTSVFRIRGVRFSGNSYYGIYQTSTAGVSNIEMSDVCMANDADAAVLLYVTDNGVNATFCGVHYITGDITTAASLTSFVTATGTNTTLELDSATINKVGATHAGSGVTVYNGAHLHMINSIVEKFTRGVYVPNTGAAGEVRVAGGLIDDCTAAVDIQHATAEGSIATTADLSTITCVSALVSFNTADYAGTGTLITGNLIQGHDFVTATNVTSQLQLGANTGVITGGATTTIGFDATVAAGTGYCIVTHLPQNYLKYVVWVQQTYTIAANDFRYLYIDNVGVLQSSATRPDLIANIYVGAICSNGATIIYRQNTYMEGDNTASQLDVTSRDGFGPIVRSGLIGTSNGANMKVNISNGSYYFSTHNYVPTATAAVSMLPFYHAAGGGGVWTRGAAFTDIPLFYDDASGVLQAIPAIAPNWAKHAIYVVNDGAEQVYLFVYAQELFASELAAQAGALPASPSFFTGNVCACVGIIVTNGDATLPAARFRDIRPTLSFRAEGASASADHNSLLNLAVGDVHTQYLLTTGARALTGDLNAGGNNVVNVNLVDGVDVPAHAARHLPGGADALTVAAPVTVAIANAIGAAASFSRSDHVHAHGAQTDGALHAAVVAGGASGFMTGADKTKLDAATNANIASTIVARSAGGAFESGAIGVHNAGTVTLYTAADANNTALATAATANYTFTLPINAGNPAQVLQTDGAGNTSWVNAAGGYVDPLTTNGDLVARIGGVTIRLPIGTTTQVLTVIGGLPAWTTNGAANPRSAYVLIDDFGGGATPYGDTVWGTTASAGGTIAQAAPISNTVASTGIVALNVSTTNRYITLHKNSIGVLRLGNGATVFESLAYLDAAGVAGQTSVVRVGLADTVTNTLPTNGVFFRFDDGTTSTYWRSYSVAGGTSTIVDSALAGFPVVSANLLYRFRVVVNAAGTQVLYYIQSRNLAGVIVTAETLVATIITNIPVGLTQFLTPQFHIYKTSGVTTRNLYVDYCEVDQIFTTAR